MKEANNLFEKIKMEILPNMRNWRHHNKTLAILAMKMHLKLRLKDSVVLVTRLGMCPGIS